jgi:signal peptidase I
MTARLRRAAGLAILVGLIVAWTILLRPVALGGGTTWIVVRGSSMLPTLGSEDLVIVRSAPAYAVGDVVAYRVPDGEIGEGHIVIHRLADGDGSDGWVVQGDNNDAPDPWKPRDADIVGAAWLVLPGLGGLFAWIHQPFVAAALAASIVVGLFVAQPGRDGGPRATRPADPAPGRASDLRRIRVARLSRNGRARPATRVADGLEPVHRRPRPVLAKLDSLGAAAAASATEVDLSSTSTRTAAG